MLDVGTANLCMQRRNLARFVVCRLCAHACGKVSRLYRRVLVRIVSLDECCDAPLKLLTVPELLFILDFSLKVHYRARRISSQRRRRLTGIARFLLDVSRASSSLYSQRGTLQQ